MKDVVTHVVGHLSVPDIEAGHDWVVHGGGEVSGGRQGAGRAIAQPARTYKLASQWNVCCIEITPC